MKQISDIKIIGHDDLVGVYELAKFSSGSTDGTHTLAGESIGHSKYEIEKGTEAAMRFSLISKQFRYLMGEVLTALEASIENERQLNALKRIVKGQFSSKISWVYEQCGCPEEEQEYLMHTDLEIVEHID